MVNLVRVRFMPCHWRLLMKVTARVILVFSNFCFLFGCANLPVLRFGFDTY